MLKKVFVGLLGLLLVLFLGSELARKHNLLMQPVLNPPRHKNHFREHLGTKQSQYQQQIDQTCQLIENGHYNASKRYLMNQDDKQGIYKGSPIVDHYHHVIYCHIGKVSSRSWNDMFLGLIERERQPRTKWSNMHPFNWSQFNRSSTRWSSLFDYAFRRLSDNTGDPSNSTAQYFSFMVVRHPLDRLASAYCDKIAVIDQDNHFVEMVKSKLIKNNLLTEKDHSTLSFQDFLSFVVLPDTENQHWSPYMTICRPCSQIYSYIAHLETLETDLQHILPKYDAVDLAHNFPHSNHGASGSDKYKIMYRNVSCSVIKPVLDKYRADADMFGYTFEGYASCT